MSISDIELNACKSQNDQPFKDDPIAKSPFFRKWWDSNLDEYHERQHNLEGIIWHGRRHRSAFNIGHDKTRLVRLYKNKWYKSDRNNSFHLFGVYSNSNTNKVSLRKMSIFGLVLTFNEADGSLVLYPSDFKASKTFFPL